MAFVTKPREEDYARLTSMMQPSATPTKRVGTEAPIGAVTAGPSAGKSAAEFTKSTQGSPGSVFNRQLAGANISGITSLAEKPLKREAGEEALRVAGEGLAYKGRQAEERGKLPQFEDFSEATIGKIASGDDYGKAQTVLSRGTPETPELTIGDVREFTPLQALRGGSVESLLKREARGPYTTGMAGLDALLFQKKGGAADLAVKGKALRATEQAAADALEKAATAEERQKMENLITSQRSGLIEGLTSGLGKRQQEFQAGIQAINDARAAQAAQAYQDTLRNLTTQGGLTRAQVINEMLGNAPEGIISLSEGDDVFADMVDVNAARAAAQGVDVESIIRGMIQPGQVRGATAADVAALSPEKKAEYDRLTQLLGISAGQDVSKYNLGARTEPLATPAQTAQEADVMNAIRSQVQQAISGVPRVAAPQEPESYKKMRMNLPAR